MISPIIVRLLSEHRRKRYYPMNSSNTTNNMIQTKQHEARDLEYQRGRMDAIKELSEIPKKETKYETIDIIYTIFIAIFTALAFFSIMLFPIIIDMPPLLILLVVLLLAILLFLLFPMSDKSKENK